MRYLRVKWVHTKPDYPVVLYTEVDDDGWEKRKVDVFADGKRGFAPPDDERFGTRLSIEPLPSIEEIGRDPQFEPSWITMAEFDEVWAKRSDRTNAS
jgi:hypothetical protein